MIYVIVIVCFIVYAVLPSDMLVGMGVSHDNLCGCLTYIFSHGSWLHLIANSLSLILMFNPVLKWYQIKIKDISGAHLFVYCYMIAVLSGAFCALSVPTVGASGVVFALLGMLLLLNPTLRQLKNYIYVALAVMIQIASGNSNVALHIVSFVFGALFIIIETYGANRRRLYTTES